MISKILVPIDVGSVSEKAIELAIACAESFDASVLLAAVVPVEHENLGDTMAPGLGDDVMTGTSYQRDVTEVAHSSSAVTPSHAGAVAEERLGEIARDLDDKVKSVSTLVASGDPAREVVEVAEREGIDLIVMATHGRSGLARGVLGSVTDNVIRHVSVPVMVLRDGK